MDTLKRANDHIGSIIKIHLYFQKIHLNVNIREVFLKTEKYPNLP